MGLERSRGQTLLAAWFTLTAAGVAAFWVNWFASGDYESAGTACYRVFENSFPLPDGVMAALLLLSATGLWRKQHWTWATGLLAGGMSLQLASLDTLYNVQHGGFSDLNDPETYSRYFICLHSYVVAGTVAAYFVCTQARWVQIDQRRTAATVCAAFSMLILAALTALYWWGRFFSHAPGGAQCAEEFHAAFWLADLFTALTAAAAAAGLLRGHALGWAAGWLHAGCMLFGTLIYGAFAAQNADLITGQEPVYALLLGICLVYVAAMATLLWRRQNALRPRR